MIAHCSPSKDQQEYQGNSMTMTPCTRDLSRISWQGFLSDLTARCNITSFEIIVDNPKSSPWISNQTIQNRSSRDDASCRWSSCPQKHTITRKSSMENLQGLGLPTRPSQEDLTFFLDESSQLKQADHSQQRYRNDVSNTEDNDDARKAADSNMKLSEYGTESESEWSDVFPSDCEEGFSYQDKCQDATVSAALISTIERLAINAALAMTRKNHSTPSNQTEILKEATHWSDYWSDPSIEPCPNEYKAKVNGGRYFEDQALASDNSSQDDSAAVYSAVCKALYHHPIRRERTLDVSSDHSLVLRDALLQEVDRIAVRAALTMTSDSHSTD